MALSQLGRAGAIWLLLAGALALAWRRLGVLVLVGVAILAAELTATALKLASGRMRPFVPEPEPAPLVGTHLDLTLPSGHAATSFAAALVLAVVVRRRWAAAALFTLAAGIAVSRVYVGVHYPSDVLAGAVVGLAVGAATIALAARLRSPRRPAADPPRSPPAPPPG